MGVNSLDSYDTIECFKQISGTRRIVICYSDQHESLRYAARHLEILWRKPPPGDSQSNGVIEALNRRLQEGTRASLAQAGLPICWWSYAIQHWCFLRNTARDATGMSSFQRAGKPEFTGLRLPFGVGVFFYPNQTKYKHQHKFQARLSYGVLVGYGVEPGNSWASTYPVFDLDDFVNRSLDDFSHPREFSNVTPHETKVIKVESKGYRFPLAQK